MIIVLKREARRETAEEILGRIRDAGLKPLHMPGSERVVLGALGDERILADLHLESHPLVESVKPILAPYKLVSREMHPHDTVVRVGKAALGGHSFQVFAGPGAFAGAEQLRASARIAQETGAAAILADQSGGWMGPYPGKNDAPDRLQILRLVGDEMDLPFVTEIGTARDADRCAQHVAALLIPDATLRDPSLLDAAAGSGKPVILKRGPGSRVEEVLLAAEYLLANGNDQVVICEQGIRTFETATPFTLDLNAVPYMKQRTHLPVIVDPSHGTGDRELVVPMALAAAACGADGLLVRMHDDPARAIRDGAQSLYPDQFGRLMQMLRPIVRAIGMDMA